MRRAPDHTLDGLRDQETDLRIRISLLGEDGANDAAVAQLQKEHALVRANIKRYLYMP